jgi:hypothetical protein
MTYVDLKKTRFILRIGWIWGSENADNIYREQEKAPITLDKMPPI